ncbi:MAG: hypothetical protein U0174_10995 [Polyangiaceae bacterium]
MNATLALVKRSIRIAPVFLLAAVSCHSPGPYGHAILYSPLPAEARATEGAKEYDPVMARRRPDLYKKTAFFGVVVVRSPAAAGYSNLTVSLRTREQRNLCANRNDEDTCRVTVSDTEFGALHVIAAIRPEDDVGEFAMAPGSLVRVVAEYKGDSDPSDGLPTLRATYYRHFPRHFYRTRADAAVLRQ